MLNLESVIEAVKLIVTAIAIGMTFLVIPCGLAAVVRVLSRMKAGILASYPFIIDSFSKKPEEEHDEFGYDEELFRDPPDSSRLIECLKSDGLWRLLGDDKLVRTPVTEPDTPGNYPGNFFECTLLVPVDEPCQDLLCRYINGHDVGFE